MDHEGLQGLRNPLLHPQYSFTRDQTSDIKMDGGRKHRIFKRHCRRREAFITHLYNLPSPTTFPTMPFLVPSN